MRTLTADEVIFVSGGESPCYALKGNGDRIPPSPAPTAKDVGDWADAASLAAQAAAMKSSGSRARWFGTLALALDGVSTIAGWFEYAGSNPPPGGQTHNTPPGSSPSKGR